MTFYNHKKEKAVSPVIGTILLVAITVVLVAIITAVVLPMADNLQPHSVVGIQVSDAGTTATENSVIVTLINGDLGSITELNVKINGAEAKQDGGTSSYTAGYKEKWVIKDKHVEGQNANVMVIATINGHKQVIYDNDLFFPKHTT